MFIRMTALIFLLLAGAAVSAANMPDIPNKTQPAEHILIGGQPNQADLRQAAEAGVRVVVNLRGEDETAGFDEGQVVTDLGMMYLRLPIGGAEDLTPENVHAFGNILGAIRDQPVLMHCASGNRVGAMYALHAGLQQGISTEAALEIGRAHGLGGLEDTVREILEAR